MGVYFDTKPDEAVDSLGIRLGAMSWTVVMSSVYVPVMYAGTAEGRAEVQGYLMEMAQLTDALVDERRKLADKLAELQRELSEWFADSLPDDDRVVLAGIGKDLSSQVAQLRRLQVVIEGVPS